MDNFLKGLGIVVLWFIVVIGLAVGINFIQNKVNEAIDKDNWNNGIHADCGGHWQYEQAIGQHWTGTDYVYVCDKCQYRETFDTQQRIKADE